MQMEDALLQDSALPLEYRDTLRLGAMFAVTVGALAALVKLA